MGPCTRFTCYLLILCLLSGCERPSLRERRAVEAGKILAMCNGPISMPHAIITPCSEDNRILLKQWVLKEVEGK